MKQLKTELLDDKPEVKTEPEPVGIVLDSTALELSYYRGRSDAAEEIIFALCASLIVALIVEKFYLGE